MIFSKTILRLVIYPSHSSKKVTGHLFWKNLKKKKKNPNFRKKIKNFLSIFYDKNFKLK